MAKTSSPTPSMDSMRGANSIESYGERNGYLSDSSLPVGGTSPPVDSLLNGVDGEFPPAAKTYASSECSTSGCSSLGIGSRKKGSSSENTSESTTKNGGSVSGGNMNIGSSSDSGSGSNSSANSANNASETSVVPKDVGIIGSNLRRNNLHGTTTTQTQNDCAQTLMRTSRNTASPFGGSLSSSLMLAATTMSDGGLTNGGGGGGGFTKVSQCASCKKNNFNIVAKCSKCSDICQSCVSAHEVMHCFHTHIVTKITNGKATASATLSAPTTPPCSLTNGHNGSRFPLPPSMADELKYHNGSGIAIDDHYWSSLPPASRSLAHNNELTSFSPQLSKIVFSAAAANSSAEQPSTDLLAPMHQSNGQNMFCSRHKNELLKYTCRTCCISLCKDCAPEHVSEAHDVDSASSSTTGVGTNNPDELNAQNVLAQIRAKVKIVEQCKETMEQHVLSHYKTQFTAASRQINEMRELMISAVEDTHRRLVDELNNICDEQISGQRTWESAANRGLEFAAQICESVERTSTVNADSVAILSNLDEIVQLFTTEIQPKSQYMVTSPKPNYLDAAITVRNFMGTVRKVPAAAATYESNVDAFGWPKQPPIARPISNIRSGCSTPPMGLGAKSSYLFNPSTLMLDSALSLGYTDHYSLERNGGNGVDFLNRNLGGNGLVMNGGVNTEHQPGDYDELLTSQRFSPVLSNGGGSVGGTSSTHNNLMMSSYNLSNYDKWSNVSGPAENIYGSAAGNVLETYNNALVVRNGQNGVVPAQPNAGEPILDMTRRMSLAAVTYPPKSNIKRQKMIYHCKFGEFGVAEAQFTEPSGVTVNAQNDIIVADTNNHRIQVFNREGQYKFHFGECGKRDNQLLYPNRVAVVRSTGDIIVTERSPTHQIQIYNQYGHFLRKFGANILQHPRGVTVDNKGRIIVVECKVMRVIIFDQHGNVVHKFGCSKHLEFPNGVVVNDNQEIFISDNRAHCVKVFNYEGAFLRQIGGEGLTNYPIGVGINARGEILIADNHNNFNLTVFTQDGVLVSALESKVKHAQCFDVALMDDYSVVLASKDYRLYIYRYAQMPATGMPAICM